MNPGGLAIMSATFVATCCLALGGPAKPAPRLIYNPTASAPLGFYVVTPVTHLRRGELVVSRLPSEAAALADRRRYVPATVPVVKTIAAGRGARVCRRGRVVTVSGHPVAVARERDSAGRALPIWSGCHSLAAGQVLLLGGRADSFDGRYFGPTDAALILGRARPLWTW